MFTFFNLIFAMLNDGCTVYDMFSITLYNKTKRKHLGVKHVVKSLNVTVLFKAQSGINYLLYTKQCSYRYKIHIQSLKLGELGVRIFIKYYIITMQISKTEHELVF